MYRFVCIYDMRFMLINNIIMYLYDARIIPRDRFIFMPFRKKKTEYTQNEREDGGKEKENNKRGAQ